jgi:hypothetical protein
MGLELHLALGIAIVPAVCVTLYFAARGNVLKSSGTSPAVMPFVI